MTIKLFIPEVWDDQILLDYREAALFGGLCDRKYEGVLTRGSTVKVTTGIPIEIHDYKAGQLLDADGELIPRTTKPQKVSVTQVDLEITEERSFDFEVDDVDAAQAASNLSPFTVSAGQGLAEDADQWIAAQIYAASDPSSVAMTTPKAVYNALRDLKKRLDKAHVPQAGRVAVLNAEAVGLFLDYDSKLTDVSTTGSNRALIEGAVGRHLGFDIYQSENLPVTDKPMLQGMLRGAFAFVSQVNKSEALRANDSFADRVRGLHVYGGKAIRPSALAAAVAS